MFRQERIGNFWANGGVPQQACRNAPTAKGSDDLNVAYLTGFMSCAGSFGAVGYSGVCFVDFDTFVVCFLVFACDSGNQGGRTIRTHSR